MIAPVRSGPKTEYVDSMKDGKAGGRMADWAGKVIPAREAMGQSRFVRPLLERPHLWRYTRRSVPRGVAAGLLIGMLVLIPGLQIVGAALLCVPVRGNIPLAAGATFLSNPVTTPFILLAAFWIGSFLGLDADLATLQGLVASGAGLGEWVTWLLSSAAPALLLGLLAIATVSAAAGYGLAVVVWRWWTMRRRRLRLAHRARQLAGGVTGA